jgi:hypothetical protein
MVAATRRGRVQSGAPGGGSRSRSEDSGKRWGMRGSVEHRRVGGSGGRSGAHQLSIGRIQGADATGRAGIYYDMEPIRQEGVCSVRIRQFTC